MNSTNLQPKDYINSLLSEACSCRTHNISKSIKLAKEALKHSKKSKHKACIGKSLNHLSLFYMIISDFKKSNDYSRLAITYFEQIDDDLGIANAKFNIGSVLYKSHDYHSGLANLLEALTIYKKHGDLYNEAKVEKAVGTIYEYIGDQENAFKTYKNAIKSAKKIGDTNLESNVLNNLSGLLLKRNKVTMAMRMILRSIRLKKESNDIRGYGFAIYGRGKIYLKTEEYDKAEKDFLEALEVHEKSNEKFGISMALIKLGKLYYKQKKYTKAIDFIKRSLKITENHNISMFKIKNYNLLYLIYKQIKKTNEALFYLEKYLEEKESIMKLQTLKVIENYELINQMNNLEHKAKIQKEKQKAIDKKNKDKRKVLKQKQEFLSIMSHEIRTPLNAITTIVSLLKNKLKGENKALFESLQFASNNLIIIVNDILDFTKLDSNKSVLEQNNINLKALCTNIINLHISEARNKSLNIVFDNNVPEKQHYLLDQPKMAQILGNLISNAIKFTKRGEVSLSTYIIEQDNTHDTIKFSIKDSGEGISKKDIAIIFDSFAQIKPITTREEGGTGLGLAIVKKLVALYDGDIKVKSELNKGSEFYFTIKLKRVAKIETPAIINFDNIKGKTALIAEDTPINAMLIKKVLSNWGIISDHVKDGQAAFEASKEKEYDFILMDIHMPVMNGFEATRMIKSQKNKNANTPIFAVTADVLTSIDRQNAYLFDDILWKPLEIDKFFAALSKYVKETETV